MDSTFGSDPSLFILIMNNVYFYRYANKMKSGVAPLAVVEDLSDIEEYTEGEEDLSISELGSNVPYRHGKSRIRSVSEGAQPIH